MRYLKILTCHAALLCWKRLMCLGSAIHNRCLPAFPGGQLQEAINAWDETAGSPTTIELAPGQDHWQGISRWQRDVEILQTSWSCKVLRNFGLSKPPNRVRYARRSCRPQFVHLGHVKPYLWAPIVAYCSSQMYVAAQGQRSSMIIRDQHFVPTCYLMLQSYIHCYV